MMSGRCARVKVGDVGFGCVGKAFRLGWRPSRAVTDLASRDCAYFLLLGRWDDDSWSYVCILVKLRFLKPLRLRS